MSDINEILPKEITDPDDRNREAFTSFGGKFIYLAYLAQQIGVPFIIRYYPDDDKNDKEPVAGTFTLEIAGVESPKAGIIKLIDEAIMAISAVLSLSHIISGGNLQDACQLKEDLKDIFR